MVLLAALEAATDEGEGAESLAVWLALPMLLASVAIEAHAGLSVTELDGGELDVVLVLDEARSLELLTPELALLLIILLELGLFSTGIETDEDRAVPVVVSLMIDTIGGVPTADIVDDCIVSGDGSVDMEFEAPLDVPVSCTWTSTVDGPGFASSSFVGRIGT